ncbi:DUF2156 domain-containing protein [Romboutsia sp. 1001713B170207_170306_H8]|uniref:DUF2156 domain-containing protein n=1 Tax=Romboutsia sp. 1001713B170207_170306_H8 TaxID=2787112 RepID=UPI000821AF00|nr:phosphatidylglycerol lysyltransferase domain-containing protein [Romboutsia sp. 1001713B170207_170306_H8]SCH05416.1 Uncharacterized conserved protein [uncultured Clostridium sp.]
MIFKDISIDSKQEIDKFTLKSNRDSCDFNFTTLYMWKYAYNTKYYTDEDFLLILEEHESNELDIYVLAMLDSIYKAVDFVLDYFKYENRSIYLKGISKSEVLYLQDKYKGQFKFNEDRDSFDYIYYAKDLKELKGRGNRKKRNHINSFVKEYSGRYEYKLLKNEDFKECLNFMKLWYINKQFKDEFDIKMKYEFMGVKDILYNYDKLKDILKIAGIYIDETLQAFTIGEKLNNDMVLIHTEKANTNIRGLYTFINQQFLINEFDNEGFVNREDDMGIANIRETKMSYHPCRFIEKYITKII